MALDFGQDFFKGNQLQGQIFLSHQGGDTTGIEPKLVDGELVLWERGQRPYDEYNSVIDAGLWTASTTGAHGSTGETNDYIWASMAFPASQVSGTAEVVAIDLPALTEMHEIEFRCDLLTTDLLNAWTTLGYLGCFGINLKILGEGETDDSVWLGVKNQDGTWNFYDDGVLVLSNQTAINKTIVIQVANTGTGGTAGGPPWTYARLYEFTIDGGVYLFAKSNGLNYKVLMTEFN